MMLWLSNALDQWQLMHSLELLATLLALAYVILAMRQSLWCWPAALLSTILFTHIMWDSALLSDALLQLYYAAMALYGWWRWQQVKQHQGRNRVSEWPLRRHLQLIAVTGVIGLLLGYLMANYTHADFAYIDAQTTAFSVMATWLVARKLVSNWLYWVVIDAVSIYVYAQKHLYFLTLLFMLYTIIALAGYFIWRANYQQQPQLVAPGR
ncbi:nicotinamide riboside transporter PnuC [Arsukibacterium sp.]|uniref:nicotinamide riboside transporter PnuC n=1 Tax=Arsukibacterium sp. TaxID=1977258 RepID=UPI00299E2A1F|nr:nicotinamide riboside transporter PnuC [Arsukibacterium sp.]MDX1537644.1 nicotinamide riboside transporter PnuC [Arsukibacterium sp.]